MKITAQNCVLLIIDIQEKFRPVMENLSTVITNTVKLVKAANVLNVPTIVSEQYPKGLGTTVSEIEEVLQNPIKIEKTEFNCFNNKDFIQLLQNKFPNIKNLIVCGIEAHVCVLQTALSALENYTVHICADATCSRKDIDYKTALQRMQSEGAKLATTESIMFQLIQTCKNPNFKDLSSIVKN